MPQVCKVCIHPNREAIDAVLASGWPSYRVVGAQYGLSKDSLGRHAQRHLPDEDPKGGANLRTHKETVAAILNNQNKSKGLGEPRQIAKVARHEKGAEIRQEKTEQSSTLQEELIERHHNEPRQVEPDEVLKQEKTSSPDPWAGWKPDPWVGWQRA